jgi:hypothetical protein
VSERLSAAIASEAKQSIMLTKKDGLLRRYAPRKDDLRKRVFAHPAHSSHNFQKHPPYLGLGFAYARFQRREVRRVAGTRHHAQEIFA